MWRRLPFTELRGTACTRGRTLLLIPYRSPPPRSAAVILNYVTAWQMIHRVAKVQPGRTALVTGAAGGVGTAALQLLRLAGVKTYGAASAPKHELLRSLGAIPIDYRAGSIDRLTRAVEPAGVDYALTPSAVPTPVVASARFGAADLGRLWFHGRVCETLPTGHVLEYFRWSAAAPSRGHVLRHH